MTCKYDTSRIEAELGYFPQWEMPRGMIETINIVRKENGLGTV
jgi:nucleoside-diphosphate-sugar epimerase